MTNDNKLSGTQINSVDVYYENVVIYADGIQYFISKQDLTKALSEFDFFKEKKVKRIWLHVDLESVKNVNCDI